MQLSTTFACGQSFGTPVAVLQSCARYAPQNLPQCPRIIHLASPHKYTCLSPALAKLEANPPLGGLLFFWDLYYCSIERSITFLGKVWVECLQVGHHQINLHPQS